MEVQALPLLMTSSTKDQPEPKPSVWRILGNTLGLGLFLLSLLTIIYMFAASPAALL